MVWVIRIGVLGQMYTEDCIFKKWVKVRHEKKFILVDISTFQQVSSVAAKFERMCTFEISNVDANLC